VLIAPSHNSRTNVETDISRKTLMVAQILVFDTYLSRRHRTNIRTDISQNVNGRANWWSMHSYPAVAQHQRRHQDRHLTLSQNINGRANLAIKTFLSRRRTDIGTNVRTNVRTGISYTLAKHYWPRKFGTRDLLIAPSHNISVNIKTDLSRALTKRQWSRKILVLDTFLSRRHTHTHTHNIRTDISTDISQLSQNVNVRANLVLDAFFSHHRTTSASTSGLASHTLSQNVTGRANLAIDTFLIPPSSRHQD
jgi:hypothetical protein